MLLGGRSIADGIGASDAYERPGAAEAARRRAEATSRANALLAAYPGGAAATSPGPADAPRTTTIHPAVAPVVPIASTAAADVQAREAVKLGDVTKQFTSVPLDQANRALTLQSATLATQAEMFGRSAAAVKGAAEAQTLWNKLAADGVVPAGQLSKATGALADQVRLYGSAAEKVAQQEEDQKRQQQSAIDFADTTRGGASSVLSGGLLSAAHGQGFGKGASSALSSFGETLISKGVNSLMGGLLGGQGSPFGGLLGGLLPHFAGGTNDAPGGPTVVGENGPEVVQMPAHAAVISNGALQGLAGAGKGHTFQIGGPTINVQGDVSEGNRAEIQRAVAAGQQQTMDHITRNFGQIQRDAGQAG